MALRIVTWFLFLLFAGLFQGQAWARVYNGGLEGGYWQSSPGFSAQYFDAGGYGSMRVHREVTATSTNDYRYIYDGRAILQERHAKNLPTWWQGGSSSDIMNAALRGGLAGGVACLTIGLGAPALSGIFGNGIVAEAINGLVSGAVSDAVNQGYDLVQGTRCEFSFSELGAGAAMGGFFGGRFSAASSAIGGMRSAMAARGAGPGNFAQVSESMSVRTVAYQGRITGLPSGTGYVANAVKYDGFANGVLLDAKGPGYANFVKNGQFQSWWNGADSFVQQAQRQLGATGGAPIQWHYSSRIFLGIT